jgi:hypothetical protein
LTESKVVALLTEKTSFLFMRPDWESGAGKRSFVFFCASNQYLGLTHSQQHACFGDRLQYVANHTEEKRERKQEISNTINQQ